jgi:group I intron endonuclease
MFAARKELKGLAGIYAIICTVTNTIYIGSSSNLGDRMMDHFLESSNIHLRNAINKHGIESFLFVIVEFVEIYPETPLEETKADLLTREQCWLDWLFSLPAHYRYNFLPTTSSSLGFQHSEETKARMRELKKGTNNPMFGNTHSDSTRAEMSKLQTGHKNPMFGAIAVNAKAVFVYNLDGVLVQQFSSYATASKWLGVSDTTVSKYIKSGLVLIKQYILMNRGRT